MITYLARRLGYVLVGWLLLSAVVFVVIQLPPGDYLTTYISALRAAGQNVNDEEAASLRSYYGLDKSPVEQYVGWITRFARGDMGRSFGSYRQQERPVIEILKEIVPFTVLMSSLAVLLTYLIAIPIGIYSATHQYRIGDYFVSGIGFIGLAVPSFMLALVLMFFFFRFFGISAGGLFSSEFALAPWSPNKLWDLLQHLWVPVIVVAMGGTASLIRVMRGTLLDELGKQYVITARAKGLSEGRLLFKYPVRLALNPIISSIGYILPGIVGGSTLVAIVLSLPMTGPVLLRALLQQDMYLAGSIVMVEAALVMLGTFVSDVLLVLLDPRIRQERTAS